ncbi:hypothetical protein [Hymenobacter negativus]|uniref:Uncharacterized protein n=1 Tax=Hymenobacter negativus TaxID=2795026 RepID=A0ABS0QA54_9BACT|nr:hypothetical protein [Hymenobacter negativus]MBH8559561.1 hypothetical protein [Hymenobacter negativus]
MRFRFLLLCLPVLLAACSKTARPVQLDFVGISALTSSNKTVQPNDTLTTRVYAVGNDNALKRLTIKVTYEPGITPIIYPVPLSSYDPAKNAPDKKEIIYLDSLIEPRAGNANGHAISETLFVNQFAARATSGAELWQYTATDVAGASASRAYRLTARKADSAVVLHSFTAVMRPVPRRAVVARGVRDRSRVFLNLQYGLLLPKYAVLNQERSVEANQDLVDLICVAGGTGNTVGLVAPANIDTAVCRLPAIWTKRHVTGLHATALNSDQFMAAAAADFQAGYTTNKDFGTNAFYTGPLKKGQVLSFKITDGTTDRYGLLLVSDLVLGSAPVLTCTVRVQK